MFLLQWDLWILDENVKILEISIFNFSKKNPTFSDFLSKKSKFPEISKFLSKSSGASDRRKFSIFRFSILRFFFKKKMKISRNLKMCADVFNNFFATKYNRLAIFVAIDIRTSMRNCSAYLKHPPSI